MSDPYEPTAITPPGAGAGEAPTTASPQDPSVSSSIGENPLPIGYTLQEYLIEGLIGEGGFGIVYLARDTQLGRVVALKEYMPSSLAARSNGSQVTVRSERQRETFELGRRSFVNEAQLLAAFDQPSLVKVYRFWEQNGTAYMVMPYYQGPTFKQWLLEHGSPSEPWLLSLLTPLFDALEVMHHNRCYHRDIAPDNILLLQGSGTQIGTQGAQTALRPMLLDFGAARRVISDATQALTVILKPGYAPIEQYAESSSMKQGAWTDVYALCAVLYAAVTGRAPTASVSRIVQDEMIPAVEAGAGRYSPEFLAVIDAGLAVRPDARPQDMAALRAMFDSVSPPASRRAADRGGERSQPMPLVDLPPPPPPPPAPRPPANEGFFSEDSFDKTVAVPPVSRPAPLRDAAPAPRAAAVAAAPAPSSRTPLIAGGAVALVVAAAGTWWAVSSKSTAPQAAAESPIAQGVASAPAAPASAVVAAPVPPPPPPAPPPPVVPFTVVDGLQDIVRNADPLLGVNVLADKSVLNIGSDRLQFRVKSKESGYVYVFLSGTDKSHFYLLFPNAIDKNNRIEANKEVLLPRKSWAITAGGPPGTNHIVTVVSRNPRDLSDVGLRPAGEEIPEFDLAKAEQLWTARRPGVSPFVGKPQCEAGAACDAGYGASLLEVEEVKRGK